MKKTRKWIWLDGQMSLHLHRGYYIVLKHLKHVLVEAQNQYGQWIQSGDYLDAPCYLEIGNLYNNSDSRFKNQAYQRIQTGVFLKIYLGNNPMDIKEIIE